MKFLLSSALMPAILRVQISSSLLVSSRVFSFCSQGSNIDGRQLVCSSTLREPQSLARASSFHTLSDETTVPFECVSKA